MERLSRRRFCNRAWTFSGHGLGLRIGIAADICRIRRSPGEHWDVLQDEGNKARIKEWIADVGTSSLNQTR